LLLWALFGGLLLPLKYADALLRDLPGSQVLASTLYVLARKPTGER